MFLFAEDLEDLTFKIIILITISNLVAFYVVLLGISKTKQAVNTRIN